MKKTTSTTILICALLTVAVAASAQQAPTSFQELRSEAKLKPIPQQVGLRDLQQARDRAVQTAKQAQESLEQCGSPACSPEEFRRQIEEADAKAREAFQAQLAVLVQMEQQAAQDQKSAEARLNKLQQKQGELDQQKERVTRELEAFRRQKIQLEQNLRTTALNKGDELETEAKLINIHNQIKTVEQMLQSVIRQQALIEQGGWLLSPARIRLETEFQARQTERQVLGGIRAEMETQMLFQENFFEVKRAEADLRELVENAKQRATEASPDFSLVAQTGGASILADPRNGSEDMRKAAKQRVDRNRSCLEGGGAPVDCFVKSFGQGGK